MRAVLSLSAILLFAFAVWYVWIEFKKYKMDRADREAINNKETQNVKK